MRLAAFIISGALLSTLNVSTACDQHGLTGIAEENNLWIPVGMGRGTDMTEERFNEIVDDVAEIYKPIIADMGANLVVVKKWEDGTVNAYAQQTGKSWKISMFGGLARHETITDDAFALVACHEIGHHIGGAPKKKSFFFSSWASNEGQADYWGNMKCFRKYVANDDNIALMATKDIDPVAVEACQEAFSDEEEVAICKRASLAGLSLGNLFRALRKLKTPLKYDTPDQNVVTKTDDSHPAPQCRLDTYFHGALCDRGVDETVSQSDAEKGVCNRSQGDKAGIRPLCWYKPQS